MLVGYNKSTAPISDDPVRDVAGNTILRIGKVVLVIGALASVMNLPTYLTVIVGGAIVVDVHRMLCWFNQKAPAQTN